MPYPHENATSLPSVLTTFVAVASRPAFLHIIFAVKLLRAPLRASASRVLDTALYLLGELVSDLGKDILRSQSVPSPILKLVRCKKCLDVESATLSTCNGDG